ncbi:MAG: guanine deaminase, partial [Psychrobacter glaciei]
FIDTHIHYPQVDVIASYGEQLLDWLNNYTFPTEIKFEDPKFAEETANFFLDELIKNGTTTALVFGSKHKQSVDAFFAASAARNTRMICGKVMMNRNAPEELCDDVQSSFDDSQALIDQWHGNGRQLYAVTPRFAITSTGEQLEKAGELLKNNPSVYMQTHLSENKDEIAFTMELFPERKSYLDIYDHYGLLGPTSVFAHGVHLADEDFKRLAETQSSISFCPTSNLFLGSGLFKLETANEFNTQVSIATDVGGGTSFSMLQTLSEAYKICQLNGYSLNAKQAFYMATLGNAKTLLLDDKIGNFESGKEADFIVVDLASTALMARKQSKCKTLDEVLFSLMILGDDRAIAETYVAGEQIYKK